MTRELAARPRGPFSLRLSAVRAGDPTRRFSGGRLEMALPTGDSGEPAMAWQRPDGTVTIRAASDEGLDRARFVLALDDDHSAFLERFRADPLLGKTIREIGGMRPLRLATIAHAVLRAICGQLVESRRARAMERSIIRSSTPALGETGLHVPPTRAALGAFAPAELRRHGLSAGRAACLVRLARTTDLERLRTLPTSQVADRLGRERGIGPWSIGIICLYGLGRTERGIEGDLGLIKLCSALRGRWVEAWETAELLEPYGEWRGLASVYLLAGWSRGLIPGADADQARLARTSARHAA